MFFARSVSYNFASSCSEDDDNELTTLPENISKKLSLYDQVKEYPIYGWEDTFNKTLKSIKKIDSVLTTVDNLSDYYPRNNEIFTAFRLCPLKNVKVVIIGQDPYPNINDAVGMSFSGRKNGNTPASLRNIFKELSNDYPGYKIPNDGWLGKWATEGVLLLNTSLTYHRQRGVNGSVVKIWEPFLKTIIKDLVENIENLILICWGNYAKEFARKNFNECHIIEGGHPSPNNLSGTFLKKKYFTETNNLLKSFGKTEINWQL